MDQETDLLVQHVFGEVSYVEEIEVGAVLQQGQSLICHSNKGVLAQHLRESCSVVRTVCRDIPACMAAAPVLLASMQHR